MYVYCQVWKTCESRRLYTSLQPLRDCEYSESTVNISAFVWWRSQTIRFKMCVKMSGNLCQIEARLSKNGSALLNGNCHVSYAMGVMAQVKQGWTSWNLWAKKRCSFIEMHHEIYHWNMSPTTHIPWYRFTFENPSKPHHYEKVSSIFGWFTLTIETYKDILEKKHGPLQMPYFSYLICFICSCWKIFRRVDRCPWVVSIIHLQRLESAIGQTEISISIFSRRFDKPLWARRSLSFSRRDPCWQ